MPPPKTKRERNPEETRRRILDAAEAEFARKGYDGTRLRDVALAVGVHHALLHHYFKDKEGLFRAVLERAVEDVSNRAAELLRNARDLRELTANFVSTLVDFLVQNEHLPLILHFASLDEGSPAFSVSEEVGYRLVRPILRAIEGAIQKGQEQGALRADIDARYVLMACLGAVAFAFHADKLLEGLFDTNVRDPEQAELHKRAAVAIVLDGIIAR